MKDKLFSNTSLMTVEYDCKTFYDAKKILQRQKTYDIVDKVGMFKLQGVSPEDCSLYFTYIRRTLEKTITTIDNNIRLVVNRSTSNKQLLTKLGIDYKTWSNLKTWKEYELQKRLLQTFLNHNANTKILVRLVQKEKGKYSIRAVLSSKYNPFDTLDALRVIEKSIRPEKYIGVTAVLTYSVHLFYYANSEEYIRVGKYVLRDGFEVCNSETGHSGLNITPCIFVGEIVYNDDSQVQNHLIIRLKNYMKANLSMSHDDKGTEEKLAKIVSEYKNTVKPSKYISSKKDFFLKKADYNVIRNWLGHCKVSQWVINSFDKHNTSVISLLDVSVFLAGLANVTVNERERFDLRHFAGALFNEFKV